MYGDLKDLLTCLTRGTRLHIGVLFFGCSGNARTALPQAFKIHAAPLCARIKESPARFHTCYRHRNDKVKRALGEKRPFFSVCEAGLLEYTHPVILANEVAALVFVGNACPEGRAGDGLEKTLTQNALTRDAVAWEVSREELVRYAAVVEGYIRLLLADDNAASANDTAPLIENLKNYIAENTAGEVDLAALARVFHYNAKYLGRLFKKQTGESFSAYVNRSRMQRAALMLRQGGKTVTEVAQATGFSSVCYFNRVFKSFWGTTPTVYRDTADDLADD